MKAASCLYGNADGDDGDNQGLRLCQILNLVYELAWHFKEDYEESIIRECVG